AVFLLNAPYGPDEVWDHLPVLVQEQIIEKRLKFYVIDGYAVADKAGMGRRINTVMQTCFFAISGVLPRDEAISQIKKAIEKTYAKRGEEVIRRNFDAVDQSLSDALRSSFGVLKGVMVVLVVLYLFSNVRSIAGHEQALKLRLGRLLPGTHEAGLVWALPLPIDEIVPLPTLKSNELLIKSHTFHRRANEIGKPLTFISRREGQGLDPSLDGALLTADTGLVHTQWKVTYKFDNVRNFVTRIMGDGVDGAEALITTYVETVGIEIASEMTADEFIRTELGRVQSEMRRRINQRLAALESGVVVTLVEMFEPRTRTVDVAILA
ncbi:MAG: 2-oxoacid:acceptor oxidoreductase family protein, partial [Chloroflexi bacterium]|nr:2-oxoacid:acceptor oxidoreductase family protein [Chloroflexota bacterium]